MSSNSSQTPSPVAQLSPPPVSHHSLAVDESSATDGMNRVEDAERPGSEPSILANELLGRPLMTEEDSEAEEAEVPECSHGTEAVAAMEKLSDVEEVEEPEYIRAGEDAAAMKEQSDAEEAEVAEDAYVGEDVAAIDEEQHTDQGMTDLVGRGNSVPEDSTSGAPTSDSSELPADVLVEQDALQDPITIQPAREEIVALEHTLSPEAAQINATTLDIASSPISAATPPVSAQQIEDDQPSLTDDASASYDRLDAGEIAGKVSEAENVEGAEPIVAMQSVEDVDMDDVTVQKEGEGAVIDSTPELGIQEDAIVVDARSPLEAVMEGERPPQPLTSIATAPNSQEVTHSHTYVYAHPAESFFSPSLYVPPILSQILHHPPPAPHHQAPVDSVTEQTSVTTMLLPPPASDLEMAKSQWGEGEFPDGRAVNPEVFARIEDTVNRVASSEAVQGDTTLEARSVTKVDVDMEDGEITELASDHKSEEAAVVVKKSRKAGTAGKVRLKPLLVYPPIEPQPPLLPQHYHPKVLALAAKLAKERGIKLVIDEEECDRMRAIRVNKRRRTSESPEVDLGPAEIDSRLSTPPPSAGPPPAIVTAVFEGQPVTGNLESPAVPATLPTPATPIPAFPGRGGNRRGRGRNRAAQISQAAKLQRELNLAGNPGPNGLMTPRQTMKEVNGALVMVDAEGNVMLPQSGSDFRDHGREGKDKESNVERDERRKVLFSKGAGSSSWWNHLLISARRQRGPQWDVNTQSYQVDRNSSLFFSYVNPPPSSPSPPQAQPVEISDEHAMSGIEEERRPTIGTEPTRINSLPGRPAASPGFSGSPFAQNSPYFAGAVPVGATAEGQHRSSGSPFGMPPVTAPSPGEMVGRNSVSAGTPAPTVHTPMRESVPVVNESSLGRVTGYGVNAGDHNQPASQMQRPESQQPAHEQTPAELQRQSLQLLQQQMIARGQSYGNASPSGSVMSMNSPMGTPGQSALSQVIAQSQTQGGQTPQNMMQIKLHQQRMMQMAQAQVQMQQQQGGLQYPSQNLGQPGQAMQPGRNTGQGAPPQQEQPNQPYLQSQMGRPAIPAGFNPAMLDQMQPQQRMQVLAFLQHSQQQQQAGLMGPYGGGGAPTPGYR